MEVAGKISGDIQKQLSQIGRKNLSRIIQRNQITTQGFKGNSCPNNTIIGRGPTNKITTNNKYMSPIILRK